MHSNRVKDEPLQHNEVFHLREPLEISEKEVLSGSDVEMTGVEPLSVVENNEICYGMVGNWNDEENPN